MGDERLKATEEKLSDTKNKSQLAEEKLRVAELRPEASKEKAGIIRQVNVSLEICRQSRPPLAPRIDELRRSRTPQNRHSSV